LNQPNSEYSKIYLKTEFAWYILDGPSKPYESHFSSFWLKHQVLHLLVTSALADPTITLAKFLQLPEVKGDISKDDIISEDMVRHSFLIWFSQSNTLLESLHSRNTFGP
jgi:DNA (cytosine-5)-methyltransferase 1